jgi:AcrR family transcriptional regulator
MKRKDEAKAREILAAAVRVAGEHGIAAMSMELVAKRAGVATGTLYVYHPSKEALIAAAYLDAKHAMGVEVFAHEGDAGLPVRPAFLAMAARYLDYCVARPEVIAFIEQVRHSTLLDEATHASAEATAAPVIALLARGKRELLLKPVDFELMLGMIHGMLREAASLARALPAAKRGAHGRQVAAMCWDAVRL